MMLGKYPEMHKEQGTRAGPIFFTTVFPQCPVQCQINHRHSKKSVNGTDPLWFPNNNTQTLIIR